MSGVFSQSLYIPVRWVLLPSENVRKRSSSKWLPQGESVNWRLLIPKLMFFFPWKCDGAHVGSALEVVASEVSKSKE